MKKKVAIFGTAGFAKEVADICDTCDYNELVFIAENITSKIFLNLPTISESQVEEYYRAGYVFAIGVANGSIRNNIYSRYSMVKYCNLIHPSATFGRNQLSYIESSKGTVIAAGVRMMSDIQVGDFVAISHNATIGHDVVLKDYVSIMPGANVSGNVVIEKGAYIGSGAVILNGTYENKIVIGENAVVGAGAVVTKSVESGATVVGSPSRPLLK